LIFLDLQLKQPPRDFLWDLLVKFGAKVRCVRAFVCAPSRSSEQSVSSHGDEVDEEPEHEICFITLRHSGEKFRFVDKAKRVCGDRDGHSPIG
jgi:hypothetical protein